MVPNTIWSESEGHGDIIEHEEWGRWLVSHVCDVNLWLVVTLIILDGWELVFEDFINWNCPSGLDFSDEIWISVLHNINVKIELEKFVES